MRDPYVGMIDEPSLSKELREQSPKVGLHGTEFAEFIWAGPLDMSGYGSAARGYVRALAEHSKYKMTVRNYSTSNALSQYKEFEEDVKLWGNLIRDVPATTDALTIQHCVPALFNNRFFRHNIGYTVYESDGLPPMRRIPCNCMNEIWVPCRFNQQTFTNAGVEVPIHVVPHVVDISQYNPNIEPLQWNKLKDKFVFYSAGDYHWRKGWDVLLKAFWQEFSKKDDVVLLVKPFSGDDSASNQTRLQGLIKRQKMNIQDPEDTAPVVFFGDFVKADMLERLYATCHCFVSSTRGEAWGLHLTEALAMEKPVIATNWSGQMEYLNDGNSYLININGLSPIEDPVMLQIEPGYYGQKMAEPSVEHLQELMRHVYNNYEEAKEKAVFARQDLGNRFGPSRIAELIDSHLTRYLNA